MKITPEVGEDDLYLGSLVPTYAISLKEFSGPAIRKPEVYRYPKRVTRANYPSHRVGEFYFSRGVPSIQYARSTWLYLNTGFEWYGTQLEFFEAGGLDTLSRSQRRMVRRAFVGIGSHFAGRITFQGLNGEIKEQLKIIEEMGYGDLPLNDRLLSGMPVDEFTRILIEERRKRKTPAIKLV